MAKPVPSRYHCHVHLTAELLTTSNVNYAVDRAGVIRSVSEGYQRACEAAGIAGFSARWGVGASLWQAIPAALAVANERVMAAAFAGRVQEYEYDCHTPDAFRAFRARVIPVDGHPWVYWDNALIVTRELPGQDISRAEALARYENAQGLVVACSNCRKVQNPRATHRWDWVRALIAMPAPGTSHGLCPVCLELYYPERSAR